MRKPFRPTEVSLELRARAGALRVAAEVSRPRPLLGKRAERARQQAVRMAAWDKAQRISQGCDPMVASAFELRGLQEQHGRAERRTFKPRPSVLLPHRHVFLRPRQPTRRQRARIAARRERSRQRRAQREARAQGLILSVETTEAPDPERLIEALVGLARSVRDQPRLGAGGCPAS